MAIDRETLEKIRESLIARRDVLVQEVKDLGAQIDVIAGELGEPLKSLGGRRRILGTCEFDGCKVAAVARGYCSRHYAHIARQTKKKPRSKRQS